MKKTNINENIITKCKVDNVEFKTMRQFLYHLKKLNISEKEYFDKFLKTLEDGKCETCGENTDFQNIKHGYKSFCCHSCSVNNKDVAKKRKENTQNSLLKKYGVTNPSQIDGHNFKVRQTCLEKYGDETYNNPKKATETCLKKYGRKRATGTDRYNEKYKKTVNEKYGVDHHTKSNIVKNKSKKTCLEKYGVEFSLQSSKIREKIKNTVNELYGGFTLESSELSQKVKKTMVEKYGSEHALQCDEIKERVKNTNLKKYNTEYPLQNKNIHKKYEETCLEKYGSVNSFQSPQTKKTLNERYGVDNVSQLDDHNGKVKETCLSKYGNEKFFDSIHFKEKYKQTSLEKYGVEYPMQNEEIYNKMMKSYSLKTYKTIFGNNISYQSETELNFIKLCEQHNIEIFDGDAIGYVWNSKNKKYFSDFKIKLKNKFKIVEIKDRHPFYFKELYNGKLQSKCDAAINHSISNNYLDFELLFPEDFKRVNSWLLH